MYVDPNISFWYFELQSVISKWWSREEYWVVQTSYHWYCLSVVRLLASQPLPSKARFSFL